MKIFSNFFKKNKTIYKLNEKQQNSLVFMLALKNKAKLDSKINVPNDFYAVCLSKEKLLDIIPSGEYELNGFTIPKTCKINKLDNPTKKGYKKEFDVDFYYVNLNKFNLKNKVDVKKVNKSFEFSCVLNILNPSLFLEFLFLEQKVFKEDFAQKELNFYISMLIYYYVLDAKILTTDKMIDFIKNKLTKIGVNCLEFEVFNNELIEKEIEEKLQENKTDILQKEDNIDFKMDLTDVNKIETKNDFNLNNLQSNSNFESYKKSSIVNLEDLQSEKIEYFICDDCNTKLPKDTKNCFNCGKSFIEKNLCENCGEEIPKNVYVCPHCKSIIL